MLKGVDPGFIMSYKAICDNCKGNGYTYVTDTKKQTEVKQCWMCESEGEINWSQAQVDDFIYNTYFALLASGSSLAISQNTYAKMYNGADFLTVISTEKSIKKHIYENTIKQYKGFNSQLD